MYCAVRVSVTKKIFSLPKFFKNYLLFNILYASLTKYIIYIITNFIWFFFKILVLCEKIITKITKSYFYKRI